MYKSVYSAKPPARAPGRPPPTKRRAGSCLEASCLLALDAYGTSLAPERIAEETMYYGIGGTIVIVLVVLFVLGRL